MPKPGVQRNIEHPEVSSMRGIADAAEVGRGSRQTPETVQVSDMNPQRLVPPVKPAGPSGKATVDPNDTLDNITSDYSASQRSGNAQRKKVFVSNP